MLSDLNSSIPISITPGNIQAIVVGDGENSGEIKYIKDNLIEDIQNQSIGYTSGTGNLFRSGVPVGRLDVDKGRIFINFYSDFSQLKYVFAEIEKKETNLESQSDQIDKNDISEQNTEAIKLKLLNDQIKILDESSKKFIKENKNLVSKAEDLNMENKNLKLIIENQGNEINQNKIDQEELKFLRLNLIHASKCKKTAFKKGFIVGTPEYKKCILEKGVN